MFQLEKPQPESLHDFQINPLLGAFLKVAFLVTVLALGMWG